MKRDFDLIRSILLDVEDFAPGDSGTVQDYDGHDQRTVNHHSILLIEAGFLEGAIVGGGARVIIHKMTWRGHDLLDAMRDESIWKKAKETVLPKVGGVALDVLLAWLVWQAKEKLHIPQS